MPNEIIQNFPSHISFPFLEDYLCDAIEYNFMIFVESEKKDSKKREHFKIQQTQHSAYQNHTRLQRVQWA